MTLEQEKDISGTLLVDQNFPAI